ncbi:MFS transporter [Phreatobacter stygius]|nr:MFS transporter [Phreatobacter stygius]
MTTVAVEDVGTDTVPWRALFLLGAASFASSAALRFCDPLLPTLANAFDTTPGKAAIVITAYAVSYGFFQLLTGPLGDRYGKVRMVTLGAILSGLFTLACAFATGIDQISVLRFLAGLTGAAIIPNCIAFIGDTVPFAQRQAVLARYMIFTSFGAISGQAIGGVLADALGWQSVFIMAGAFLLLAGTVLAIQQRSSPVLSRRQPAPAGGVRGSLAQMLALRNIPYARVVLMAVTIEAVLFYGTFTFLGAHLRQVYNISYTAIGAMTALSAAGAAAYSWSAPFLLGRFGERAVLGMASVFLAASFALLALTPPVWLVAVAIAIGGFGFVLLHNPLQTNATQMTPGSRGAGIATFAFCFFAGQTAGVALCSLIYDQVGAPPLFAGAALLLPVLVFWFRAGLARTRPV